MDMWKNKQAEIKVAILIRSGRPQHKDNLRINFQNFLPFQLRGKTDPKELKLIDSIFSLPSNVRLLHIWKTRS